MLCGSPAGHDTTASLLSFTFWNLSQHAEVQKKLQAEIDAVLQGGPFMASHLDQLPYTRSVLHESLRVHAPVPALSRVTTREVELLGQKIPAGVGVSMRFNQAHLDEQFWPDPHSFKPERWMSQ